MLGGKMVYGVFRDKPDRLFWAWLYYSAELRYLFRSFCEAPTPPAELAEVLRGIAPMLRLFDISLAGVVVDDP